MDRTLYFIWLRHIILKFPKPGAAGSNPAGGISKPSKFAHLITFLILRILNHCKKLQNTRLFHSICSLFVAFLVSCGEKETAYTPPCRGNYHPMSNGSLLSVFNWIVPFKELLNRRMVTHIFHLFGEHLQPYRFNWYGFFI